ncbi:hypothetical protein B9Z55_021295 [Caenorhabditis nigoni]|nr:hypothetical protein B9Z55_021295 [Caenorhabditis nigoni]
MTPITATWSWCLIKDSKKCHVDKNGDSTPTTIFWRSAVCMPKDCDEREISTIFNQISDIPFTACGAHCSSFPVQKTPFFWIFTIFMAIIILVALASTLVDFLLDSHGKTEKDRNLALRIFLTFSFWTNAEIILSVKEQKPGFIKCLDCIRFLSMLWVVSGHTISGIMFPDVLLPVTSFTKHFWNHLILNAFFSVDTFFLLSGIVVAYLFFKNPLKKSQITSPITWILFYVHRYLRLTPPLMIFIGFYIAYSEYIQGPTAAAGLNSITYAVNGCKKTWWRNLLYINNFGDSTQACYGITWYIAVDTQLYLIAPIILIALWFSIIFGFLTVAAGCAGSIITVYILYAQYHLPADQFGKGDFEKATYYNFSRFLWSIAVSWVIVANHMGWGGPINNFMSHPIWQPLGRLSYCAYIVHFFLIPFYENLNDSPMHYYSTFQIWIYYAVPITILAYVFAFFWSCLFEIPTLKLEKMLIEVILGAGHQRASGKIEDLAKADKLEKEETKL